MVVALYGANWTDNFGDTLFIEIFSKWIREAYPDIEVVIPWASRDVQRHFPEFDNSKKFQAVVFIGGGYFSAPTKITNRVIWSLTRLRRHFEVLNLIKKQAIPYCIIGVAVNNLIPFLGKYKIRSCVINAEYLSVRDEKSVKFVNSNFKTKAIRTFDSVLSLANEYPVRTFGCNGKIRVGIHFNFFCDEHDKYFQVVKWLGIFNDADKFEIVFISDHGHLSKVNEIKKSYSKYLDIERMIIYSSLNSFINDINDLDIIISSKLHVPIVGLVLNKLVLSIPSHEKTEVFFNEIGASDYCVKVENFSQETALKFNRLIESKKNFSLSLDIKNKALLNRNILYKFLNRLSNRYEVN